MEIIVELRNWPNGFVCVYHGDGTIKQGWPAAMDYIPASAVAVGDITGDGIPESSLPRVWESFYKVDASRTRTYGGTGLGLHIVQSVLHAHGGTCGVDNVPGGVTFWFELPAGT
jgi:signal transduction histidine kinase